MSDRRYAENTKVPVLQSRAAIEKVLRDYGVSKIAVMDDEGAVTVMFTYRNASYRFKMPQPDKGGDYRGSWEQEERRLYRCFFISIKSKVVAVENDIATFEEAFMPHVITKDGRTIGQKLLPEIEQGTPAIDIGMLALPGAN